MDNLEDLLRGLQNAMEQTCKAIFEVSASGLQFRTEGESFNPVQDWTVFHLGLIGSMLMAVDRTGKMSQELQDKLIFTIKSFAVMRIIHDSFNDGTKFEWDIFRERLNEELQRQFDMDYATHHQYMMGINDWLTSEYFQQEDVSHLLEDSEESIDVDDDSLADYSDFINGILD